MRLLAGLALSVLAISHAAPARLHEVAPAKTFKAAAPRTSMLGPVFSVLRKLKEPAMRVKLVEAMKKKLKLVKAKRVAIREMARTDQKFRANMQEALRKKALRDPKMRLRALQAGVRKLALKKKSSENRRKLLGGEGDLDLSTLDPEALGIDLDALQQQLDLAGVDLDLEALMNGEIDPLDPDQLDPAAGAALATLLGDSLTGILGAIGGDLEEAGVDLSALDDLDSQLEEAFADLDNLNLDMDFGDFQGLGGQEHVELSVGLDMMCVFTTGDTADLASVFGEAAAGLEELFEEFDFGDHTYDGPATVFGCATTDVCPDGGYDGSIIGQHVCYNQVTHEVLGATADPTSNIDEAACDAAGATWLASTCAETIAETPSNLCFGLQFTSLATDCCAGNDGDAALEASPSPSPDIFETDTDFLCLQSCDDEDWPAEDVEIVCDHIAAVAVEGGCGATCTKANLTKLATVGADLTCDFDDLFASSAPTDAPTDAATAAPSDDDDDDDDDDDVAAPANRRLRDVLGLGAPKPRKSRKLQSGMTYPWASPSPDASPSPFWAMGGDFWGMLGDDFDFDSIDLGDEFDFDFAEISAEMELVGESMDGMMDCMCSDGFKDWATDPANVDLAEILESGEDPQAFAGMEPLMCDGAPTADSSGGVCYNFMSEMWNNVGSMAADLDGEDGAIMTAVDAAGGPEAAVGSMMECMCSSSALFSGMMGTSDEDFDLVGAGMDVSAVGFCANTACMTAADVFSPIKERLHDFEEYSHDEHADHDHRRRLGERANRRKLSAQDACTEVPEPEGTVVTFTAVIEGDAETFDKDAYAESMAQMLGEGVDESMITVLIEVFTSGAWVLVPERRARALAEEGELRVTAEVETGDPAVAANAAMQLESIAEDTEMASALLGVTVAEIPEDAIGGSAVESAQAYQETFEEESESGLSTGALIGIIAGGFVGVIAIGVLLKQTVCKGPSNKVQPDAQPGAY